MRVDMRHCVKKSEETLGDWVVWGYLNEEFSNWKLIGKKKQGDLYHQIGKVSQKEPQRMARIVRLGESGRGIVILCEKPSPLRTAFSRILLPQLSRQKRWAET